MATLAGTLIALALLVQLWSNVVLAQAVFQPPKWPRTKPGFALQASKKRDAGRDFHRDWATAHQRWGKQPPKSIGSSFVLGDQDGQVDVYPIGGGDVYVADISVGTPPQKLNIALDTGSADFWMQSSDTRYLVNRKGPWAPRFRPNASSTSSLISNADWGVRYVDGTDATGIVYHDTVKLGNFEIENVTIQSAKHVASKFESDVGLSGILGLAKDLPNNVNPPSPSFLQLLRSQLQNPVFTVDILHNSTGRFDFGYIDERRGSDTLTWLDSIPGSPYWDIRLDLTTWPGSNDTWWSYDFTATVDTGTTLMFLPKVLTQLYWSAVPGMSIDPHLSNAYTFPCRLAHILPDIMFKLPHTEHVLTVPGSYLNYGPVVGTEDSCWSGMQSADDLNTAILGDVMLKAVFVAFDIANSRVGFANKVLNLV